MDEEKRQAHVTKQEMFPSSMTSRMFQCTPFQWQPNKNGNYLSILITLPKTVITMSEKEKKRKKEKTESLIEVPS